ncbi:MAG TPA: hypothetical protein VGQ44_20735 [Gemmatimonadaceae bacterium]|jgi:hypothetical protein|nr:hypothetical protein [Gemmatimonadaceae bacterium]
MPFSATVLRVMIASPGDVPKERAVVREVVGEWNSTNGSHRNVMLLAVGWETDVAPEMGDAPQSIIDKRILTDADLLVGIFWTRLGTPTASYASGAVEEIEVHLKARKPAMLYFSSAPAPLDAVDPAQYQALKTFKDSCRSRGLYASYADVEDFRRQFSKDLQIVMNADGVASADAMARPKTTSGVAGASLSPDALMLLSAASADGSGVVLFERFGGGAEISSNDKVFNEDSSPRTLARWEGAIEELEKSGLLRATSAAREVFELTRDGFAAADAAKTDSQKPVS